MHRTVHASLERDPKQIGETEIFSAHAPLVVERSFVGGHDAATTVGKIAELLALRIRKRRDVRQNKCFELVDMFSIQKAVMHHLEGNAGLDERLIKAERMIFESFLRAPAA